MSARIEPLRQDLRERGLLGSDNRLTAAGHAHAAQLIEDLRSAERSGRPARAVEASFRTAEALGWERQNAHVAHRLLART